MLRWHERLKDDASLDMLLTFFLNCYALRDWLHNSGALDGNITDIFVKGDPALSLCRDLCNRSKHLILTGRPSVDADFSIVLEYRGNIRPAGIVILAGGVKSDLHDIANQCKEAWILFLSKNNLLEMPSSRLVEDEGLLGGESTSESS